MFTENANRIFNRVYRRVSPLGRCGPSRSRIPYAAGFDRSPALPQELDRHGAVASWRTSSAIRPIDPAAALAIKRRIDKSNQERTDMVEYVDSYLLDKYRDDRSHVAGARLNTETPAWAIDRLSILALKIYHMALRGGAYGRGRGAPRGVPEEAGRAAGAAGRTFRGRSKS